MDPVLRILRALTGANIVMSYVVMCECMLMTGQRAAAEAARDAIALHGAACDECGTDIRIYGVYNVKRMTEQGTTGAQLVRLDASTLEPTE